MFVLCFWKTPHVEPAVGIVVDSSVGPEVNGEVMPKHMRQSCRSGIPRRIKNGWVWSEEDRGARLD